MTNLPPRAMMGIDSCGMLISAVHHEGRARSACIWPMVDRLTSPPAPSSG
ncbi:MAG: hypothetical protein ACLTSG_11475 [Lachnospiraceae bacterium]